MAGPGWLDLSALGVLSCLGWLRLSADEGANAQLFDGFCVAHPSTFVENFALYLNLALCLQFFT